MFSQVNAVVMILTVCFGVHNCSLVTAGKSTDNPIMTIEAEQVWLETKDIFNLRQISGRPVAIYRKDLDDNYVAYWELTTDNDEYVIISAGKKTGDRKRVTQGQLPSMTQIVDKVAAKYGQTCFKYYMVSPSGEMLCENSDGRIVATSIDKYILTDLKFSDPHEYIQNHLSDLDATWAKQAYDVGNTAEWDDEGSDEDENAATEVGRASAESAVVPGESVVIAVGQVDKLIDIGLLYEPDNLNDSLDAIGQMQFKLCQCSGICEDDDIFAVNRSLVKVDPDTGLGYLRFQICTAAWQIFESADISFIITIVDKDGSNMRKRFGLEYDSGRRTRGKEYKAWSPMTVVSIPDESLFPDYKQFTSGKCPVGCGPVAWAQVFGYFDRRSHKKTSRYGSGSQALYRSGSDGTTGSNTEVAPSTLNGTRIRGYTQKVAETLRTFCFFGGGATLYKKMKRVSGFFKDRQTSGSPAIHDKSWLLSITGVYRSSISTWARSYLKSGWPVIVGVREGSIFKQHYAVATQYRYRSRKYRNCYRVLWKKICFSWKTQTEIDMFTHQGWGGNGNRWRKMEMFYAVAAKY